MEEFQSKPQPPSLEAVQVVILETHQETLLPQEFYLPPYFFPVLSCELSKQNTLS